MKGVFQRLLEGIPDYKEFLTLEELDASSRRLAERFSEVVSVFSIGETKEGRDIVCLKIGSGSKKCAYVWLPSSQ